MLAVVHLLRQARLVPQRLAAGYGRHAAQPVAAAGQPFQGARAPDVARVVVDGRPEIARQVDQEHQHARGDQVCAHGREQVERAKPLAFGIGVHPARHAGQAGEVHREEGHVKAHEHQPETPAAQPLGQGPLADERCPVIEGREQRKHHAAEQHVMQMRHDEVSVVRLQVERDHGDHDAGQAADDEHEEEPQDVQHRRLERP